MKETPQETSGESKGTSEALMFTHPQAGGPSVRRDFPDGEQPQCLCEVSPSSPRSPTAAEPDLRTLCHVTNSPVVALLLKLRQSRLSLPIFSFSL